MSTAILLSGGMDSIALAHWRRPTLAITVDYGQQSAAGELRAAADVCQELKLRHEVVRVDCKGLGSGDLAGQAPNAIAPVPEWWPFRNQLLITIGLMRGIALGINEVWIGCVTSDHSHVDGTPGFIEAIDRASAMQEGALRVLAPAITLSSAELIRTSGIHLELLGWAHSCHKSAYACGSCRGCNKHRQVMTELGYETY